MNPSCIYNRQSKAVRALWNFLTSPTGAFLIAVSAILIGYYQFYISRPILKYTTETTEISSASGSDDFKIHINGKDYPKLYKTAFQHRRRRPCRQRRFLPRTRPDSDSDSAAGKNSLLRHQQRGNFKRRFGQTDQNRQRHCH